MFFGWKRRSPELKEVILPGECGTVGIPANCESELENDSTLLIAPRGSESINLRITSLSFSKPDIPDEFAARAYLRERAAERGLKYEEHPDRGVVAYDQESDENGTPLLVKFWEIGIENTLVILSATITKRDLKSPAVLDMLQFVPALVTSVKITKFTKCVTAEGRSVQVTEEAVEPVEQSVRNFVADELAWLAENLSQAQALGVKYGSGGEQTPEELDRVFSRWQHDGDDRESDDILANALGAAFGDYLVHRHGFRWVVVTDQYGTDFAVSHPQGSTMAFPKSSVEKRIDIDDPELFQNLSAAIAHRLQEAVEETE